MAQTSSALLLNVPCLQHPDYCISEGESFSQTLPKVSLQVEYQHSQGTLAISAESTYKGRWNIYVFLELCLHLPAPQQSSCDRDAVKFGRIIIPHAQESCDFLQALSVLHLSPGQLTT